MAAACSAVALRNCVGEFTLQVFSCETSGGRHQTEMADPYFISEMPTLHGPWVVTPSKYS